MSHKIFMCFQEVTNSKTFNKKYLHNIFFATVVPDTAE